MTDVTRLRDAKLEKKPRQFFFKGPFSGRPGLEMAAVHDETGWYHIHPDGRPAYESRYLFTGDFKPALTHPHVVGSEWSYFAVAQEEHSQYTYINQVGLPQTSGRYLDARPFSYGLAPVEYVPGGWCHLNYRLQPAYKELFDGLGEIEQVHDEAGEPYLRCDAVKNDRFYRIFIYRLKITILPCIAW